LRAAVATMEQSPHNSESLGLGLNPGDPHYRAYVGPPEDYDLIAAMTFNLLTTLNLRQHHTVLDVGCGSLRIGRLLIPYLNAGNYFAIEPNQWLVEEGISKEIGQTLVQLKAPHFFFSESPGVLKEVKVAFDFAFAQSIFSHCGLDLILPWLLGISQCLAPAGVLLATFFRGEEDSPRTGWIYPGGVAFRPATLDRLAAQANLRFQVLDWRHPTQTWGLFAAPGFDTSWFRDKPLTWNNRLARFPSERKGRKAKMTIPKEVSEADFLGRMRKAVANAPLTRCPVCGNSHFTTQPILWQELINQWQLSDDEVDYINLQQGFRCANCKNNLRSMTLAAAITRAFDSTDSFEEFCRTDPTIRRLAVVEVNPAGTLSPFLQLLPGHRLHSFPQLDMQRMNFENESIDILVHSDTLEHVPDSKQALKDSWRVLKRGGHLFYTVPIVVGRLTQTRQGFLPSYHGKPETLRKDYLVQTEYGADFWCEIFEAAFDKITLTSLSFPASVAIGATKGRNAPEILKKL
jgi:SAM-dependent methyltransferase